MTLSQELLTLESIARLALSDIRAMQPQHDLLKEFHEAFKAFLEDYTRSASDQKLRAIAYDR